MPSSYRFKFEHKNSSEVFICIFGQQLNKMQRERHLFVMCFLSATVFLVMDITFNVLPMLSGELEAFFFCILLVIFV
jgi:hypothetical protein